MQIGAPIARTQTQQTPEHKRNTPVVLITCFMLDFLEHAFMLVIKAHSSGAGGAGARKMHRPGLAKRKVTRTQNMKHVVQYDV